MAPSRLSLPNALDFRVKQNLRQEVSCGGFIRWRRRAWSERQDSTALTHLPVAGSNPESVSNKTKTARRKRADDFGFIGRSDRIRTCGIEVPNFARYQLRHAPKTIKSCSYNYTPANKTCQPFAKNFSKSEKKLGLPVYKLVKMWYY